jgi:hypothetical protein
MPSVHSVAHRYVLWSSPVPSWKRILQIPRTQWTRYRDRWLKNSNPTGVMVGTFNETLLYYNNRFSANFRSPRVVYILQRSSAQISCRFSLSRQNIYWLSIALMLVGQVQRPLHAVVAVTIYHLRLRLVTLVIRLLLPLDYGWKDEKKKIGEFELLLDVKIREVFTILYFTILMCVDCTVLTINVEL